MYPAPRSRRRYRIADTPSGLPFGQPSRPRPVIPALIALVVVAAAIGVFVGRGAGAGGSSRSGAGTGPSRAGSSHAAPAPSGAGAGSTAAQGSAAERRHQLSRVLRPLAGARLAGLAEQRSAADAAEQARAIATIAGAYHTAAARLDALPDSPAGLRALLADLASSYHRLAAAARAANPSAYRRLAARIQLEEQQLRARAASL